MISYIYPISSREGWGIGRTGRGRGGLHPPQLLPLFFSVKSSTKISNGKLAITDEYSQRMAKLTSSTISLSVAFAKSQLKSRSRTWRVYKINQHQSHTLRTDMKTGKAYITLEAQLELMSPTQLCFQHHEASRRTRSSWEKEGTTPIILLLGITVVLLRGRLMKYSQTSIIQTRWDQTK